MDKVKFRQEVEHFTKMLEEEDGDSERYPFIVGLIKGTIRDNRILPADKLNQIAAILEAHENAQGD
ncbi:hypothetical protein AV654_19370 [Paenibacillus elgii]|uniref:Uncharacterized protein n=1 Tax=Paenibacillus elgii TaxID=189691 RepID=A0A163XMP1_9BACL|nr:hypothetical protein [Paenibacillus elgii]KZE78137.1 hypothetical protein AV654_19370 [Paenibacillus elgii]